MTDTGIGPTLGGFIEFVQNIMRPPTPFDPTTSPYVEYAYNFALQFANSLLQCIPGVAGAWTLGAQAVYNLAADTLINFAQDASGDPVYKDDLPYWAWLRAKYNVNSFIPGIVQSSGDEGTSVGYLVPEAFSHYTIANLQELKTPYGRQYLSISQSFGTLWTLV